MRSVIPTLTLTPSQSVTLNLTLTHKVAFCISTLPSTLYQTNYKQPHTVREPGIYKCPSKHPLQGTGKMQMCVDANVWMFTLRVRGIGIGSKLKLGSV